MVELLRDVFFSMVRDKAYVYLRRGLLRSWGVELIYKLIDDAMNKLTPDINEYLRTRPVRLENMRSHADYVARTIVIRYVKSLKVE